MVNYENLLVEEHGKAQAGVKKLADTCVHTYVDPGGGLVIFERLSGAIDPPLCCKLEPETSPKVGADARSAT